MSRQKKRIKHTELTASIEVINLRNHSSKMIVFDEKTKTYTIIPVKTANYCTYDEKNGKKEAVHITGSSQEG